MCVLSTFISRPPITAHSILPWVLETVGFAGAYVMLILGAAGVWGSHGPLLSWPSQFLDGPAASTGFAVVKTIGAFGSFLGSYLVGALMVILCLIVEWVVQP